MVDVFGDQFNYLRIDPDLAQAIEHEPSYIKHIDGNKKERNIFCNVSYDDEERNKLKEIENMAVQNNINHRLFGQTGQILKFLYANQFDIQKTFQNMMEHIEWIDNPITFNEKPLTIKHLQEGYIYIGGNDKFLRPTAIFNAHKIDLESTTEESIISAYNRIFKLIEEYQFYKSKIESWNVIIETNEISAMRLPIKILGKIITTMQNNFPSNLNKLFILNPSTSLNITWKVIAAFISERSLRKISFLKKSEMKTLLEFYDPDQLEEKFGGTTPNVTQYYPPVKFPPNQAFINKVKQRKSSSRGFANFENVGGGNEYQYRQSQQATMYQNNSQEFNSQLRQSNVNQQVNIQYGASPMDNQQQYRTTGSVTNLQNQQYGTGSVVNKQLPTYQSGVYTYQEPQSQSYMIASGIENKSNSMRFTKQKQDDQYTIQMRPPGFRDELQNRNSQQQVQNQHQPYVSKYSVVNNAINSERISQINQNFLDSMEEDQEVVKRSKKTAKTQQQTEVKDPKYPDYMDRLRDQNYKACTIF